MRKVVEGVSFLRQYLGNTTNFKSTRYNVDVQYYLAVKTRCLYYAANNVRPAVFFALLPN